MYILKSLILIFIALTAYYTHMIVDNMKNLCDILNQNMGADLEADENFDFLGSSPYFDDTSFIESISDNKKRLTIFSTNIQCLRTKHDALLLQLALYNKA